MITILIVLYSKETADLIHPFLEAILKMSDFPLNGQLGKKLLIFLLLATKYDEKTQEMNSFFQFLLSAMSSSVQSEIIMEIFVKYIPQLPEQ